MLIQEILSLPFRSFPSSLLPYGALVLIIPLISFSCPFHHHIQISNHQSTPGVRTSLWSSRTRHQIPADLHFLPFTLSKLHAAIFARHTTFPAPTSSVRYSNLHHLSGDFDIRPSIASLPLIFPGFANHFLEPRYWSKFSPIAQFVPPKFSTSASTIRIVCAICQYSPNSVILRSISVLRLLSDAAPYFTQEHS